MRLSVLVRSFLFRSVLVCVRLLCDETVVVMGNPGLLMKCLDHKVRMCVRARAGVYFAFLRACVHACVGCTQVFVQLCMTVCDCLRLPVTFCDRL